MMLYTSFSFLICVAGLGTVIGQDDDADVWTGSEYSNTDSDSSGHQEEVVSPPLPNFVIIYIDQVHVLKEHLKQLHEGKLKDGFAVKLGNISSLLNKSVYFENVYSEMTTTSSASSLLTGKPAVDTGMIQGKILPYVDFPSLASSGGLLSTEKTISSMLHGHGYFTGYVGRWTLGVGGGLHLPVNHGFDVWTGFIAPSMTECRKMQAISRQNQDDILHHPYIIFLKKTLPIWVAVIIVLATLYCFHWLHLREVANALFYTIFGSLILYLLFKAFQVQRLSACLLYKNMEIIEQPYDSTNFTLYATLKASKFLKFCAEAQVPFYLHLSYTLTEDEIPSSVSFSHQNVTSTENSLLELDWSIGKIIKALDENGNLSNTVILLTGGNDCFRSMSFSKDDSHSSPSLEQVYGFLQTGFENFKILPYDYEDNLQKCLHVPLLLNVPDWTSWEYDTQGNTALFDIYLTIENIIAKYLGNKSNNRRGIACSLIQDKCSTAGGKHGSMKTEQNLEASDRNESSNVENSVDKSDDFCTPSKRVIYHYADIIRPAAVTLPGLVRIVFANVTDGGRVIPLAQPVVFPLSRSWEPTQWTNEILEGMVRNASNLVEQHLNQERPNRWSSQFEMPVYPWYFPCANFPRCEKRRAPDDFSFLGIQ